MQWGPTPWARTLNYVVTEYHLRGKGACNAASGQRSNTHTVMKGIAFDALRSEVGVIMLYGLGCVA